MSSSLRNAGVKKKPFGERCINKDVSTVVTTHKIVPKTYAPPEGHFMMKIPALPGSLMGFIIGKDGAHFCDVQQKSGCSYVWYNRVQEFIEVWGATEKTCEDGMAIIKEMISNVVRGRTRCSYGKYKHVIPVQLPESLADVNVRDYFQIAQVSQEYNCKAIYNPTNDEIIVFGYKNQDVMRTVAKLSGHLISGTSPGYPVEEPDMSKYVPTDPVRMFMNTVIDENTGAEMVKVTMQIRDAN